MKTAITIIEMHVKIANVRINLYTHALYDLFFYDFILLIIFLN